MGLNSNPLLLLLPVFSFPFSKERQDLTLVSFSLPFLCLLPLQGFFPLPFLPSLRMCHTFLFLPPFSPDAAV